MKKNEMKIVGTNELAYALRKYGKDAEEAVREAVRATALNVEADAVKSIQGGIKSGSVYEYISDGEGTVIQRDGKFFMFLNRGDINRTHQSSAPGEAPATDTGNLASSIKTIDRGAASYVGTDVDYGEWLEFGTRKMAERPFIRPAIEKNRPAFLDRLRAAAEEARRKVKK